ncbi:unnamed protein product [Rotaria sordida]|nr:unnamed protein product [Rotaria sordida]
MSIWLNALKRVTVNGMPTFVNDYLLKIDRQYQHAFGILENHVENIIQNCQKEMDPNARPVNLVASLISSLQKDEATEKRKPEKEQIGITKKELLGEVLGLIVAGFDTSSSILSWFIHFVNKCQYIDCVIKEILRLAPILFGTLRTLLNDIVIDGIKFYKGDTLASLFTLMQHDPRYWKLDPTEFIPERFFGVDAPDVNYNPFVFIPFGGGHRACIGQDLARLELKVIIIRYMLFVTFIDAPGNNGGHRQGITIAPKELAVSMKFD